MSDRWTEEALFLFLLKLYPGESSYILIFMTHTAYNHCLIIIRIFIFFIFLKIVYFETYSEIISGLQNSDHTFAFYRMKKATPVCPR